MRRLMLLFVISLVSTSTNAQLDTLWTQTFRMTAYAQGESVIQSSDGGFVVAGYGHAGMWPLYHVHSFKTDENGIEEWQWIWTVSPENNSSGADILETEDGRYVLVGSSLSDLLVMEIDGNGVILSETYIGGSDYVFDPAHQNPPLQS